MKNVSLRTKLLTLVILPALVCTFIAVVIAAVKIRSEGEQALKEKSTAILTRLEAVRGYVAKQGMLDVILDDVLKKYPDGKLPESEKKRILNQVPIFASMAVGKENAAHENYEFRVASNNPRNPKNKATPEEAKYIDEFESTGKDLIIHKDEENDSYWVMSPVYLSEDQGCLTCHGNPANSPFGNGKDMLGHTMENWNDGDIRGMFKIVSDLKPVNARVNKAIINIGLWGFLVSIVTILLGIFVVKKINVSIEDIVKVTQKVSKGDLTSRIKKNSNDELGQLSDNINKMTSALNNILSEVKESSQSLAGATEEISAGSTRISEGAQKQAAEFEEISSTVQNTAQSVSDANHEIKNSNDNADSAEKAMVNTARAMDSIKQNFGRIVEVTDLIAEISHQTNLLALNAAVEAARAGQHGRGFAVVAAEIRKLAEKSAESTKEISEMIQTNLKEIDNGVNTSKEAEAKIKEIIQAVSKVALEIDSINTATQHQATAMENNTNITASNAAAAEEFASSADQLAEQAHYLNEIVRQFTLADIEKKKLEYENTSSFDEEEQPSPENKEYHIMDEND